MAEEAKGPRTVALLDEGYLGGAAKVFLGSAWHLLPDFGDQPNL